MSGDRQWSTAESGYIGNNLATLTEPVVERFENPRLQIEEPTLFTHLRGTCSRCIGQLVYLPRTRSVPEKSNSNLGRGSLLTRSLRRDLSREMICETLATESFGNPVSRADKLTLPGAKAHFKLLVSGTQIAVAIRLWFRASP